MVSCQKKGSNKIVKKSAIRRYEDEGGAEAGRALLSMLRSVEPAISASINGEPQPLSKDEFLLGELQAREDRELGADRLNALTFGVGAGPGWSFEENVVANERLLAKCPKIVPFVGMPQMLDPKSSCETGLVRRLEASLLEVMRYVDIKQSRLKEALHLVLIDGWKNITWRCGYTALHLAAELGCTEVMPLLVVLGADPSSRDSKGRNALDVADKRRNICSAVMLTRMQNCSRIEDIVGDLPDIINAAPEATPRRNGHEPEPEPRDVIGMASLVSHMKEDDRLKVALCVAMRFLNLEPPCFDAVLCLAISHGTLVGRSSMAMHRLVEFGRDDLIPLAVALGAHLFQVDGFGRTPYDLAVVLNRQGCIDAMEHYLTSSDRERLVRPQPPRLRCTGTMPPPPPFYEAPDFVAGAHFTTLVAPRRSAQAR
jgi:hypothetical protein